MVDSDASSMLEETVPPGINELSTQEQSFRSRFTKQKTSRSYYAVQDADLQMEADMEKGLFLAASSFLDQNTGSEEIYAEVIRSLELAKNFLYKYENFSSPLIGLVDEVVQDAANLINMDTLRKEFEECRWHILKRALELGFGRQSEPQYEWEYKMPMKSQIPITPTLNSFLLQKKSKSAKSATSSTTRLGRRSLKSTDTP